MDLEQIHRVYFLGIGGIGMSALARWFKRLGKEVAGYDRTPTPLTDALQAEGMDVHFEDDPALIGGPFRNREHTLVVFTPAIPEGHAEMAWLQQNGFKPYKRAEVLGKITEQYRSIAVAGTHGKTTTASMLAWLLHSTKGNCAAFMGGIANNFAANLLLPAEGTDRETTVVAEADEYDRSFLKLHPDMALITAVEPDHLDIYGAADAVSSSFTAFAGQVAHGGNLLLNSRADLPAFQREDLQLFTFGLEKGDFRAETVRIHNGAFVFDFVYPQAAGANGKLTGLRLEMPGFHNVENAVGALAAAMLQGADPQMLKEALATYSGVQRRFQQVVKNERYCYIDDYAHHPTEIAALLRSVRALYPGKRMTVVFQPHLFSRTRDFAQGFAESLAMADEVALLNIYPAREKPVKGVASQMLLELMPRTLPKVLLPDAELLGWIAQKKPELLLTVGAGDIDRFVQPIQKLLTDDL